MSLFDTLSWIIWVETDMLIDDQEHVSEIIISCRRAAELTTLGKLPQRSAFIELQLRRGKNKSTILIDFINWNRELVFNLILQKMIDWRDNCFANRRESTVSVWQDRRSII